MRLTDVTLDAFGVLSHTLLDDLQPGLNVFHGSNGSGKTTILRFLRGVWIGFDEARRLKLLPPLAEGQAGGSLGLAISDRRCRITRQALPNETDRVAIASQPGDADDGATLRGLIDAVDHDIARLLFTPGGEENHHLAELLLAAARDGIDLKSGTRPATHLRKRIELLRARREVLTGDGETPGATQALHAATQQSTAELAALRDEAATLRSKLADQFTQVDAEILALADRVEWLDLERQAADSNLLKLEEAATHSRLTTHRSPSDVPPTTHDPRPTPEAITRAAQVLEDLAIERMRISVHAAAQLPIDGTTSATATAYRERGQLDRCETELLLYIARLRSQLAALPVDAPQAALVAPVLASREPDGTIVRCRACKDELTADWQHAKSAWRDALALREAWDIECSRLVVLEQRIAERQLEIESRTQQLQELLDEAQSLLLTETALAHVQTRSTEEHPAPVIEEASQHLARLTDGRYRTIVAGRGTEINVANDSGLQLPLRSLSRGTLDQVGLSLRIALSAEYARRGLHLPLVLDDVLSDCDAERLDAAVSLLCEAAQSRQILFLTCQERLCEAFERHGVNVRDLPGSRRRAVRPAATIAPPAKTTVVASAESQEVVAEIETLLDDLAAPRRRKVQPAEPHWLRADSPIVHIPSLGEQMARRIGTAGVRTIADLVEFDLEHASVPLDSLQITPSRLRIWQAEARLLCCVPDLTGRDAQLLVAVGILLPQELAQSDADQLVRRIDRLRGDGRSGWVTNGLVWPDRRTVIQWIDQARRARTFRESCDAIGRTVRGDVETAPRRRFETARLGRQLRVDQPAGLRGPRRLGPRRLERRAAAGPAGDDPQGFTIHHRDGGQSASASATAHEPLAAPPASWSAAPKLRFNLQLDSAVEDAPSIGPTTAKRLHKVGIVTVADLVNRDPEQIAERLQHRRVNAEAIRVWQQQARLMCRVPELRGHDAQVLVACGITEPEAVAAMSPQALFHVVGPFVATRDGQRLLRSAKSPDLAEVTDWIRWSQQSRQLKVA
jgi:predicted flap endonuclease-1-like 5' DNA nuclease